MAIAAEREKDHSIDLALLLANEAVGVASEPTPDAQSALLSTLLTHAQVQKILGGHDAIVRSVAFSPHGKKHGGVHNTPRQCRHGRCPDFVDHPTRGGIGLEIHYTPLLPTAKG
ncbi:MAG: hypothetical protein M3461_23940 [Pseudomonadota bacterium]|nr:hypothetical protein [Pseudomonadota bacterium]